MEHRKFSAPLPTSPPQDGVRLPINHRRALQRDSKRTRPTVDGAAFGLVTLSYTRSRSRAERPLWDCPLGRIRGRSALVVGATCS